MHWNRTVFSRIYRWLFQSNNHPRWKPFALRAPTLIFVSLLSAGLIIVLQRLLVISREDGGLLFAPDVNELPLSKSFWYLYLPTMIAIAYSLLWSWIDLSVKRMEPFYQLSQPQGASAENSLLLKYPVEFIPFVPFQAAKRRHWSTFLASTGMLLVFWALTPLQAAIFANDMITQSFPAHMLISTSFLPSSEQNVTTVGGVYTRLLYEIAWLNATLPSFMTRNFTLAPFSPELPTATTEKSELWIAATTMFSVNITCEEAEETQGLSSQRSNVTYFRSSNGCVYTESPQSRVFTTDYTYDPLYANQYSSQDDAMQQYRDCPADASNTFMIGWIENTGSKSNLTGATCLFCNTTYYQQEVSATVAPPYQSVVNVLPLTSPSSISEDIFNITEFEMGLARHALSPQRKPSELKWEDHSDRLGYLNLTTSGVPPITPFAIAAHQRPAKDYLDPILLQDSYQAAYRLLFAQRMVNILNIKQNVTRTALGERRSSIQALIVVPVFVYTVQSILAVMSLFSAAILCFCITRSLNLISNPASLTSIMSLVADNSCLLNEFKRLDQASSKELKSALKGKTYSLAIQESCDNRHQLQVEGLSNIVSRQVDSPPAMNPGIRPTAFRMWIGFSFLTFQIFCFIALAVIRVKTVKSQGMPLPSSNRFVQQLVENYLPIIIATLMEPIWILLNRYLCILQPFEELRYGQATAKRSISADYTSLPPQFAFGKAFRSRHFILGAVCWMAMLANLLAVAFSSLFYEAVEDIASATQFPSPFEIPLNGEHLHNFYGSDGTDHIYLAMSNLTSGTPMPAYTDNRFFYLPFDTTSSRNTTWQRRATTGALGAKLDCVPLLTTGPNSVGVAMKQLGTRANITVNILGDETKPSCSATGTVHLDKGEETKSIHGPAAVEVAFPLCNEYLIVGWMRGNASLITPKGLYNNEVYNVTIDNTRMTFLACHSRLFAGTSEVVVDGSGKIQHASLLDEFDRPPESWFVGNSSAIFAQQLVIDSSKVSFSRSTWHTDSSPYNLYHELVSKGISNSSRYFDPSLPTPPAEEAASLLSALYSKIFAIWLSSNLDTILSNNRTRTAFIPGVIIKPTTRLFISRPMFILSEVILGLYISVTIVVYVRRPGRFLPRLPTSLASVIAFFAASDTVSELQRTSGMSTKERNSHVERLGHQYGYGKFVGTDGKAMVGIQTEPQLVLLRKEDLEITGA